MTEVLRPVAAPVQEPGLEIPEVSEADVGKKVLSETCLGTLTGVVEKFVERDGLGVWSIRWVWRRSHPRIGGLCAVPASWRCFCLKGARGSPCVFGVAAALEWHPPMIGASQGLEDYYMTLVSILAERPVSA